MPASSAQRPRPEITLVQPSQCQDGRAHLWRMQRRLESCARRLLLDEAAKRLLHPGNGVKHTTDRRHQHIVLRHIERPDNCQRLLREVELLAGERFDDWLRQRLEALSCEPTGEALLSRRTDPGSVAARLVDEFRGADQPSRP